MAGFAQGVTASVNSRRSLSERNRIQVQAEMDAEILGQRKDTAAAIEAQAKLDEQMAKDRENDSRQAMFTLDKLDGALVDAAYGDLDSFNDFIAEPENAEILLNSPAIRETFGAGIKGLEQFNPQNTYHTEAREEFVRGMGQNKTYESLSDPEKQFVDTHMLMASLDNGQVAAMRSDELLVDLSVGERRSKARRLTADLDTTLANIRTQAEKEKLAVVDPAYSQPKGTTPVDIAKSGASAYKALRDSGAAPEVVQQVMGAFGIDINEESIRKQMDAEYSKTVADTGLAEETIGKYHQQILDLESEAEQLVAFNTIGANSGLGEKSGALVKELIDSGTKTIDLDANGNQVLVNVEKRGATVPARLQYLDKAQTIVSDFNTRLAGEKTEDGQPATWENFALWPEKLKADAALLSNEFDTLTESSPLSQAAKSELSTLNQTIFSSSRFVEEGRGETKNLIADTLNFFKSYLPIRDRNRRIAKSHELAGILVAASLNDRTSKYLFERVDSVFGSDFGQSFLSALGGAELFLSNQRAKIDSIKNETTNPFTRARLDFYSNQIDKAIFHARTKLGIPLDKQLPTDSPPASTNTGVSEEKGSATGFVEDPRAS